jgi:hypothetical protein
MAGVIEVKMKRYLLELGQLAPSSQGYSYARRAQSVVYTMQWQQDSISDDLDALKKRFDQFKKVFKGRIVELGKDIVWESSTRKEIL